MKTISFLAGAVLIAAAGVLAGCGSSDDSGGGGTGGSSGSAGAAGSAGAGAVAQVVDCSTVTPAQTVSISGAGPFTFDPATVSVSVGDAVEWKNTTAAPHTSTSGQSGVPPTADGKWDTGAIAAGAGTACVKFLAKGSYPYFCSFHTTMSGTVTVQ